MLYNRRTRSYLCNLQKNSQRFRENTIEIYGVTLKANSREVSDVIFRTISVEISTGIYYIIKEFVVEFTVGLTIKYLGIIIKTLHSHPFTHTKLEYVLKRAKRESAALVDIECPMLKNIPLNDFDLLNQRRTSGTLPEFCKHSFMKVIPQLPSRLVL